jgi:hypothetical protein
MNTCKSQVGWLLSLCTPNEHMQVAGWLITVPVHTQWTHASRWLADYCPCAQPMNTCKSQVGWLLPLCTPNEHIQVAGWLITVPVHNQWTHSSRRLADYCPCAQPMNTCKSQVGWLLPLCTTNEHMQVVGWLITVPVHTQWTHAYMSDCVLQYYSQDSTLTDSWWTARLLKCWQWH